MRNRFLIWRLERTSGSGSEAKNENLDGKCLQMSESSVLKVRVKVWAQE